MFVCVWVSQSASRVPVLIFAVAAALTEEWFPSQGVKQERHSSPSRYWKVQPAMYRSASLLDSQEVMALYPCHKERYCLKDDGSISEVRVHQNATRELMIHDHDD